MVKNHLQQLERESHIVYTEPRAKYALRSSAEASAPSSNMPPEPIGVTLIPLQSGKNFASLARKIAAFKKRQELELQQQENQRAEEER